MRIVDVIDCRVAPGKMKEFTNAVQQWERRALERSDAPEFHAVLLDHTDPGRVMLLTQFSDEPLARSFADAGLMERFLSDVMSCLREEPQRRRFDLYYAGGTSGPAAIFGE